MRLRRRRDAVRRTAAPVVGAASPSVQARGAVWLGFADSSGVTLAPNDPAALALRAVADAMLRGR
jgi:hypothetical protein